MAENIPMGAALAVEGRYIWANAALAEILGIQQDEVADALEAVSQFIVPEDMPKIITRMEDRNAGRPVPDNEHIRARTRDGRIVHLAVTTRSITWHGSETVIMVVTDETETIQARKDLAAAKDMLEQRVVERTAGLSTANHLLQAEMKNVDHLRQQQWEAIAAIDSANRAKDDFLSDFSHEIRTPLAGLVGMTELLQDTLLNKEQQEYVEKMRFSADAIQALISDVLDYSRIESGRMELTETPFLLRDCLSDMLATTAMEAQSKGLELALRVGPSIPDNLLGDPGRFRQAVYNLVVNAIKHTDTGEVFLNVVNEGITSDQASLCLNIIDTSPGITEERLPKIFEPFAQVDASCARRINDTGIGLAISRGLAEIMGGRLDVESRPRAGTTFRLHLPFRLAERRQERPGISLPPSRDLPMVLVVDDNPTQCCIIEEMIVGWGMKACVVEDPDKALKAAGEARAHGTPFELILIDASLPRLDGFELAGRFRQIPEFGDTRIIMLTNVGSQGDAVRCREMGLTGYLRKPLRESELRQAIEYALNSNPDADMPSLATPHTFRKENRRLNILLVEDNPINREVTLKVLQKCGHQTASAENGQECLHMLKNESFDLVLMDIQIPIIDGFETCRRIREKEAFTGGHLPIIAVTAQAMAGDRENCLRQGMDGYISKPFRAKDLIQTIETIMHPFDSPSAPEPPPSPMDTPHVISTAMTDEKSVVFDRDDAMVRVDGDEILLAELGQIFMETVPQQLETIRHSHQRGEMDTLRQCAHALKGAAGSLSAWSTYHKAMELESLARTDDSDAILAAVAALEKEIERLFPMLQKLSRKDL